MFTPMPGLRRLFPLLLSVLTVLAGTPAVALAGVPAIGFTQDVSPDLY